MSQDPRKAGGPDSGNEQDRSPSHTIGHEDTTGRSTTWTLDTGATGPEATASTLGNLTQCASDQWSRGPACPQPSLPASIVGGVLKEWALDRGQKNKDGCPASSPGRLAWS